MDDGMKNKKDINQSAIIREVKLLIDKWGNGEINPEDEARLYSIIADENSILNPVECELSEDELASLEIIKLMANKSEMIPAVDFTDIFDRILKGEKPDKKKRNFYRKINRGRLIPYVAAVLTVIFITSVFIFRYNKNVQPVVAVSQLNDSQIKNPKPSVSVSGKEISRIEDRLMYEDRGREKREDEQKVRNKISGDKKSRRHHIVNQVTNSTGESSEKVNIEMIPNLEEALEDLYDIKTDIRDMLAYVMDSNDNDTSYSFLMTVRESFEELKPSENTDEQEIDEKNIEINILP